MKRNFILLIILIGVAIIMTACPVNQQSEDIHTTPDRLEGGSREQIAEPLIRSDDWQQIVEDSDFQIGDEIYMFYNSETGEWNNEDRNVSKSDEKELFVEYGTYPLLNGSTVCLPMAIEFARQHLKMSDKDAYEFTYFDTTAYAYFSLITKEEWWSDANYLGKQLLSKPIDLILVTEPSKSHLELAQEENVKIIKEPICYDAFVFITHKDNPIDSLTVEQVQKIYSGEITNWNQVGGEDAEITAYQREKDSGSQTTMEQLVMDGKKMMNPITVRIVEMSGLIDAVAEYQNNKMSIGYTFKYYVDMLYKSDEIKILKVDGVEPTNENISESIYPFTTNYFGVIRSDDKNNTGGIFLEWIISDEGQRCIEQAGYCPL